MKFCFHSFSDDQEVIRQVTHNANAVAPRASTATKELDDLMASLSDFKVSFSLILRSEDFFTIFFKF